MKQFKLSDQFIGALMIAFQRTILNEEDITELIRGFKVVESDDGLVVLNPPVLRYIGDEENSDA